MNSLVKIVLSIIMAAMGVLAVVQSLFWKGDFYFAQPVSEKSGSEMPKWLARPFFFVLGVASLALAVWVWVGS